MARLVCSRLRAAQRLRFEVFWQQTSDWAYSTTDHFLTFQQLREPPSDTRHSGSQPWASKQHSTRWNTVAYGRFYGCKALRNHTYSYSQSSATSNEQQCTLTTSNGEPRRETHSLSTLLFNPLLRYIMKPITERWKQRVTTESNLSSTTPTRTSPTLDLQTTFFSSAAH